MSDHITMPARRTVSALRAAATDCRACPLWRDATQTVFGDGSPSASIMLVGEQPGDREDLVGRPFVGPAGRVLAEALEAAGIGGDEVYVTNAVKHFKFQQRGKRRIHKKPGTGEIEACRPWLEAEIAAVKPRIIVALGATAARSLLGPSVRIGRDRGTFRGAAAGAEITVTAHPSSVLRERDHDARAAAMEALVADLRAAAARLRETAAGTRMRSREAG